MRDLVGAVIVLIVLASASLWYLTREKQISEAPARSAALVEEQALISTIDIEAPLSIDRVAAVADEMTPLTLSVSAAASGNCRNDHCSRTAFNVGIAHDGATLSFTEGSVVRISTGIDVSIRVPDDDANNTALHNKRFHAKALARSDVDLGEGAGACPSPRSEPTIQWTEGNRVEVAPDVRLDIGQLVATEIRDVVRTVSTEAIAALCEEIKAAIEAAWVPRSYRVAAFANQPALRLHIEPLGLGFSGLGLTRDGAVLQLTLTARTVLSGSRTGPRPRPTPALQDSPLGPTALKLISPVEIDYEHLEKSLADRLVDQPLSIAIPTMTGTVTPRAVRILSVQRRDSRGQSCGHRLAWLLA